MNHDAGSGRTGAGRRLRALVLKESIQVVRDPSTLLIAFVLPMVLLLLFAYAISLDIKHVRFGVALEGQGPAARALAAAFEGTPYLDVRLARSARELEPLLVSGDIKGFAVIPEDFEARLASSTETPLQIVTDGSQPNTANFTAAYAEGVFQNWRAGLARDGIAVVAPAISITARFWFNPELESRRVLLPGAIAIVMTMIGTLLTALVIAREWERGTMEALMATPASLLEMLAGKLLPYFALGLAAMVVCTIVAVAAFNIPLRGSPLALLALSCCFLLPALGQGLLISTLARNQFVASQIALLSGFLPALLLSGFLFEIDSMPAPIRLITYVVPARYFVDALQTLFLAGNIPAELLRDAGALLLLGGTLFAIIARTTRRRLD